MVEEVIGMSQPVCNTNTCHPLPAPVDYAGQWVAWNKQRTQIVAHGTDMAKVHAAAVAAGHSNPIVQRVRHPDVHFIGMT